MEGQTDNFTTRDNFTPGDKIHPWGRRLPLGAKLRMALCDPKFFSFPAYSFLVHQLVDRDDRRSPFYESTFLQQKISDKFFSSNVEYV
jgi:hypothetical protein